jgi:hypothetical protein
MTARGRWAAMPCAGARLAGRLGVPVWVSVSRQEWITPPPLPHARISLCFGQNWTSPARGCMFYRVTARVRTDPAVRRRERRVERGLLLPDAACARACSGVRQAL